MSTQAPRANRSLPQNPDLRQLKKQAAELLSTGSATSVADSQYQLALEYGFTSWLKLKAHAESAEAPSLSAVEAAIHQQDLNTLRTLIDQDPDLLQQEGYWSNSRRHNQHRPLDFAAARGKLDVVRLLLEAGASSNSRVVPKWRSWPAISTIAAPTIDDVDLSEGSGPEMHQGRSAASSCGVSARSRTDRGVTGRGTVFPIARKSSIRSVYHVLWGTCREGADIVDDRVKQSRSRRTGGPCDMGCDEAVFRPIQRMIRLGWFDGQHIETCTRDPPVVQRAQQGSFVDEWTSTRIHEESRRLHQRQALGTDDSLCLRGQRAVQADNV